MADLPPRERLMAALDEGLFEAIKGRRTAFAVQLDGGEILAEVREHIHSGLHNDLLVHIHMKALLEELLTDHG